ncbi:MAG: hydrolase [Rhodospirillales bacterium]|nr:hydrolase [Rhodospirillales bacterium]
MRGADGIEEAAPTTEESPSRPGASLGRISLVVADVDGTLLTSGKVLTEPSLVAATRLQQRGVAFSIVSSRPPFGMRSLVECLALRLPVGAFNGGALVATDLTILDQCLIGAVAAGDALSVFENFGIDAWLYTGNRWIVRADGGPHIERQSRTIGERPVVAESFAGHLAAAAKIVGVSSDGERLGRCEIAVRRALGERASVARSQPYYVDMTPAGTDKGVFVATLARRLCIPLAEVATIGDMENDIPMFRRSGFAIAMGNAGAAVKRSADAETLSNEANGFAAAVEQLILPRCAAMPPLRRRIIR